MTLEKNQWPPPKPHEFPPPEFRWYHAIIASAAMIVMITVFGFLMYRVITRLL